MRKYMPVRIGLISILFCCTLAAFGQVHTYLITYRDKKVGTVETRQVVNGEERSTLITSVTSVQLFRQYKVTTRIQNKYDGEILRYAKTERITNTSNDNLTTITERKGGQYMITRKGRDANLDMAAIHYCVSDLYFKEPVHINQAYSETNGQMLNLTKMGKDAYILTLPDGKQNYYRYSAGKLVSVEAVTTLGKIYFILEK